jgi:hypothetical protein
MSPDWADKPEAVPYSDLHNPQSLNLYAYVSNNPLSRADFDGHNWLNKLGNLFTEASCWCEGAEAAASAKRNQEQADAFMRQNAQYVVTATILTTGIYGASIGPTAPESAEGAADVEAGSGWVKVGRWMSQDELANMKSSGVAQESADLGGSRVALPADASAYKGAPSGSVYVEYEIPAGSAKQVGSGWAKIPGPNSIEGRLAAGKGEPVPQMPAVRNIEVKGQK